MFIYLACLGYANYYLRITVTQIFPKYFCRHCVHKSAGNAWGAFIFSVCDRQGFDHAYTICMQCKSCCHILVKLNGFRYLLEVGK